jgi:predicted Rossmann-fold nucleotide-binding protein
VFPGTSGQTAPVTIREIETLGELDDLLAQRPGSMSGWRLQGLDLREYDEVLGAVDPQGSAFFGCRMSPALADRLRDGGGLVLPRIEGLPFSPWRGHLYSPADLYRGLADGYAATLDARVYHWSRDARIQRDPLATLAAALHDHAVDDALTEALVGHSVVGVMGGHRVGRESTTYRTSVDLGRRLAGHGLVVATGGGPGAMEAANLGARLASAGRSQVDAVLERLGEVPEAEGAETEWARSAATVASDLPDALTLGVPTWFYGHEPPNLFATSIAKFFANARREDTLLRRCNAGIVFLPGAGGTVQELFQDACENYYARPGHQAPMVLVDREYWTEELPAWPLLRALAEKGGFLEHVHLVDHPAEIDPVLVTA